MMKIRVVVIPTFSSWHDSPKVGNRDRAKEIQVLLINCGIGFSPQVKGVSARPCFKISENLKW